MEPFTLVVWLMMGPRFEETRIEGLTRAECAEQVDAILGDRGKGRAQCISANGLVYPRPVAPAPVCAHSACGPDQLPPGRSRV